MLNNLDCVFLGISSNNTYLKYKVLESVSKSLLDIHIFVEINAECSEYPYILLYQSDDELFTRLMLPYWYKINLIKKKPDFDFTQLNTRNYPNTVTGFISSIKDLNDRARKLLL